MTVVDTSTPPTTGASTESVPAPKQPKTAAQVARERTVTAAISALLVVALAAALFALFEGPFAQQWYEIRQHQLASQFQAARSHTGRGAAIAVMQVPTLRVNLMVAEGDSPEQLRSGPGHRIGTPMPGSIGNSVIVGHRHGWGGPFASLDRLKVGDAIALQFVAPDGSEPNAVFHVISVQRVGGNDLSPFAAANDRRVTIVTGGGGRFTDERLVITAVSSTTNAVGKTGAVLPGTRANTSAASPWTGNATLLALAGFVLAALAAFVLRRRYRATTVALVVVPLALCGILGAMLVIDAALPGTW